MFSSIQWSIICTNVLLVFLLSIQTSSSQQVMRLQIHQGMPKDLETLKNIWSTLANYHYNMDDASSNDSTKPADSPWAVRSQFLSGLRKHVKQQNSQQEQNQKKQSGIKNSNEIQKSQLPSSNVYNFKDDSHSNEMPRKAIVHRQHNKSNSSEIFASNFESHYDSQIESPTAEPLDNPQPVNAPPPKPVQNTSNQTDFSLYSVFGNAYLVEAFAGSQGNSFNLMLDTGSSYTWLTQKNCTSCQAIGIKKSFDCEESTTCANQKKEVNLVYGRGRVNATVIKDSLGLDHKLLAVQNQDMLLASSISDLKFFPGHGLLGLGFEELSDGRATFVSNLKMQGKIDKRVFAISLQGNSEEIEFGQTNKDFFIIGGDGIDEQLIEKADSFTCPVTYSPYWSVDVSSIVPIISDVEMDIKLGSQVAVIDTGTSFIVFDSEDFDILCKFFFNKLKKLDCVLDSSYNLIKCQSLDKSVYPIFKFSLCNHSRPILVYPEQYLVCDTACYVRIAGISFGFSLKRMVILGDIFIRQQYVLFNQDDLTITFFNKKKQTVEP